MHLHSSPAYSVGSAVRQSNNTLIQKHSKSIKYPVLPQLTVGPGTYSVNPVPSLLHHPSWK